MTFEGRPIASDSDHVSAPSGLPTWPSPLKHNLLSHASIRQKNIMRMKTLINQSPSTTFAIFVYELADERRIILDGNHRVAAALEHSGEPAMNLLPRMQPSAVVFVMKELKGCKPVTGGLAGNSGNTWKGFNPDVELLRASQGSPTTPKPLLDIGPNLERERLSCAQWRTRWRQHRSEKRSRSNS